MLVVYRVIVRISGESARGGNDRLALVTSPQSYATRVTEISQ